ncbi:hypothetical protein COTS27_00081 [Spirochaetota bacterium]|nr:hypothetical protein COTS27_00081 [Spirochaetota bacterium]
MESLFYGIRYRNVAIAYCTQEELLLKLIKTATASQSLVVAPVTLRDLVSFKFNSRKRKEFAALSLTFPVTRSILKALAKEFKPEEELLAGKIFIELTDQIARNDLMLVVWGLTPDQETQLKNRFKLLLDKIPKSIYLSEAVERTHAYDQIEVFIRKTEPDVVYMTWRCYRQFPNVADLLPRSVIIIIDIPLAIYAEMPPKNIVFSKIKTFFGYFNLWRALRFLYGRVILANLKKQRGNLKPLP